ncbi:ABC transporter substrate-binding protein [Paenibacillus sp. J2TS4]|uniref:ABC transporter substrate-binding protein n=1 Tax=Paenibacillus sp. J2TS4 TaxID=2807194 RepID=UPI001B02CEAD|nr:ABC transporter substrate-binding protein [Paenibacillus sp. J2TS4]GIP33639.1 sugar ABC transporter substrate-binding protein [Paenibacillus sp. J2TS4]
MKWRSTFPITFSFLVIISIIFGCSQASTDNNKGKTDTRASETNEEVVEIDFWYGWTGPGGEAMEELIAEFNESQDKIKVKGLSQSDYQKQLTAITGGNPPDVASNYSKDVASWGSRGAMTPLDDYIAESQVDMDDFIPTAMETSQYDGTTYAIPLAMHVYLLFYNKDIFAEAGLDGPPETISELMEYADKLTVMNDDGRIERLGFFPSVDPNFYTMTFTYGGRFWDADKKEVTPEDPGFKQSMQFAKDIWDKYGAENLDRFATSLGKVASPQDPFYTGKYAMRMTGEYEPKRIEDNVPELNYGIAPVPYDEEHPELKNSGFVGASVLYIPKGAKHPDEAWEFLSWLTDKDQMSRFDAAIGNLPTRMSALDHPAFDDVPGFDIFLEYSKSPNLQSMPSLPFMNEYMAEINKQYDAIMRKKVTLDEGTKRIKEKIQPLVEKTME